MGRHANSVNVGSYLGAATVRAYAKGNGAPRELAHAISALATAERWKIEELHTEEGRLDEVFRSITQSETKLRDSV